MILRCGSGHTWRDGADTGHCANCHRTFLSLEAFDRHQSIRDGKTVCADPSTKRWFTSIERDGVTYYTKKR